MAFRNRYILEHSEKVVFAAIDPNGALSRLIGEYPDLQWQVLASVGSAGGFILDHRDGHNRPMNGPGSDPNGGVGVVE